MAGGFIADSTSLPLVVSNLVNIVSADFFHIGFVSYAVRMIPVDLIAIAASLWALYLFFRRDLPRAVAVEGLKDPHEAIRDPKLFRASWIVLGLLLVGYLVSQSLHIPVSVVAGTIAILLLLVAHRSPAVDLRRLVVEAPSTCRGWFWLAAARRSDRPSAFRRPPGAAAVIEDHSCDDRSQTSATPPLPQV